MTSSHENTNTSVRARAKNWTSRTHIHKLSNPARGAPAPNFFPKIALGRAISRSNCQFSVERLRRPSGGRWCRGIERSTGKWCRLERPFVKVKLSGLLFSKSTKQRGERNAVVVLTRVRVKLTGWLGSFDRPGGAFLNGASERAGPWRQITPMASRRLTRRHGNTAVPFFWPVHRINHFLSQQIVAALNALALFNARETRWHHRYNLF